MNPNVENRYQASTDYDTPAKRLKQILLPIGVVVLLIAVGLIARDVYLALHFRVTNTNPLVTEVATASPFFDISFNKEISKQSISVTSNPSIISSYTANGKILAIELQPPLSANKTYTITIHSITDTSGALITDKVFSFQPKYMQTLPKDQNNAALKNQAKYAPAHQDPILAYLPYSTLDFSLNPTFTTGANGQQELVLQAQLLLAPGVSGNQASANEAQYKQEVLTYIQSLGLKPANYTIQYQLVNESLTGP